ncbi:MAG: CheY-like chemotaxis protein [Alteromonadaceae bacterium]|jgi:CheY-like chemotaxis protein
MEDDSLTSSVLIVDDSALNVSYISNIIEPLGHDIHIAKNGLQALKSLKTLRPSIIIMDIGMPEMSGFECCQQIKKYKQLANIPIIFLTGSHDEADKEKAFSLGAKAYLTKPVRIKTLENELEKHMPWA